MSFPGKTKMRGNTAFYVFDHICLNPGSTRSDVAGKVGLSITAVGRSVDFLIDEGLVSAFPGLSSGGRPAEILFPSRNKVFLAEIRERSVCAFLLDMSSGISFFEERAAGSEEERSVAMRDLICRVSESPDFENGSVFAASFLSYRNCPVDPDDRLYAKSRLSPLFVKTFDADLLSARVTSSKIRFAERALFCSVGPDGADASFIRRKNDETVFGKFSSLTSSYGTGFGRVFASCRNEKEAGEALSDALLNTVALLSPEVILIEISGGGFDEKLGEYLGRALSAKISPVPGIKTFFKDRERLRTLTLSLLRQSFFEKKGKTI